MKALVIRDAFKASSASFSLRRAPHCFPLLWITCVLVGACLAPSLASESDSRTYEEDRRSIAEANRLLEEEIKLASRSLIYLVLDPSERVILIKGRGIELQRIPIMAESMSKTGALTGVFHLRARPPVIRPKASAAENAPPAAIELQHMPREYRLVFDPGLTIIVAPPVRESPWLWAKSRLLEWWDGLTAGTRFASKDYTEGPRLRLTLSQEAAQLLAWSVIDGMPLIIGRTTISQTSR